MPQLTEPVETEEPTVAVTAEEADTITGNIAAFFAEGNTSMMGGWTN